MGDSYTGLLGGMLGFNTMAYLGFQVRMSFTLSCSCEGHHPESAGKTCFGLFHNLQCPYKSWGSYGDCLVSHKLYKHRLSMSGSLHKW